MSNYDSSTSSDDSSEDYLDTEDTVSDNDYDSMGSNINEADDLSEYDDLDEMEMSAETYTTLLNAVITAQSSPTQWMYTELYNYINPDTKFDLDLQWQQYIMENLNSFTSVTNLSSKDFTYMNCDLCHKNEYIQKLVVFNGRHIIYAGKRCEYEFTRASSFYKNIYNIISDPSLEAKDALDMILSI